MQIEHGVAVLWGLQSGPAHAVAVAVGVHVGHSVDTTGVNDGEGVAVASHGSHPTSVTFQFPQQPMA